MATAATAAAATAATAADGSAVRRRAAWPLHRHVRDELLQVIVGDVSWLERGERVPAVLVEGGSVKE